MNRILKTRQAYDDLAELTDYITSQSPRSALRFLKAADRAFRRLATMPRLGREWSRKKELAGIRVWSIPEFKNFLIFYRPIDDGIEILRVLHGARNLKNLLEVDE